MHSIDNFLFLFIAPSHSYYTLFIPILYHTKLINSKYFEYFPTLEIFCVLFFVFSKKENTNHIIPFNYNQSISEILILCCFKELHILSKPVIDVRSFLFSLLCIHKTFFFLVHCISNYLKVLNCFTSFLISIFFNFFFYYVLLHIFNINITWT